MPATYEPIATTTLGSATASITFSSIPATYTDLVLVVTAKGDDAGGQVRAINLTFNNDSGSNYARTFFEATNGGSVDGGQATSQTNINLVAMWGGGSEANTFGFAKFDIFSYANSSVKKTFLIRSGRIRTSDIGSSALHGVALWNSTSAINRIDLVPSVGNFEAKTRATIYGILRA